METRSDLFFNIRNYREIAVHHDSRIANVGWWRNVNGVNVDWFQVDLVPSPSCRTPQNSVFVGIRRRRLDRIHPLMSTMHLIVRSRVLHCWASSDYTKCGAASSPHNNATWNHVWWRLDASSQYRGVITEVRAQSRAAHKNALFQQVKQSCCIGHSEFWN